MSRHLHLYWSRGRRGTRRVTYDMGADTLGTGGDITKTVLKLIPHSDFYTIHHEARKAIPADGGTALLHRHLPIVTFTTTNTHLKGTPTMTTKFRLTLDSIASADTVISKALPSPLDNLFDEVIESMDGGDQDVYATVGYGLGITRTLAGDWAISDYHRAVLTWHLENYAPVKASRPPYMRRISDVVETILRLAVTDPGDTRQEAAQNLTSVLTDWATATYEA